MIRKHLIIIYNMSASGDFSQGTVACVIQDARDVGCQLYANEAGSSYFTLPLEHPALSIINPLQQHYEIRRWDGTDYVPVQAGIITDYDSSENEVVITGVDYMAALNKYYTPIHGPAIGEKAIPDKDETPLGHDSTSKYAGRFDTAVTAFKVRAHTPDSGSKPRNYPTAGNVFSTVSSSAYNNAAISISSVATAGLSFNSKNIIAEAITVDKQISDHGVHTPKSGSTDSTVGKIEVWSGSAQSGTTPTGEPNKITVSYVEDGSGNKTGDVNITGALMIYRGASTDTWIDAGTGLEINGNFKLGSSTSAAGGVGFLLTANPGGPAYVFYEPTFVAAGTGDIGDSAVLALNFSLTVRPTSHYTSPDEDVFGLTRTVSILTEGVSYTFTVKPFYLGTLTPTAGSPSVYDQYIWGNSGTHGSTATAGLESRNMKDATTRIMSLIMDRNKDFPDTTFAITSVSSVSYYATVAVTGFAPSAIVVGDSVTLSGNSNSTINSGTYTVSSVSTDRKTIYLTASYGTTESGTGGNVTKDQPILDPIVKFTTVEHLGDTASTSKHPYTTAGQGPVDFLGDIADLEMGSRVDQSKVVFNYYGVPGMTPTGKKLLMNHNVSASPVTTLVYPGDIRSFNVINKRSSKTNSIRVVPTTDFLVGASTDGASGTKSRGVVKVSSYSVGEPALPAVVSQGGFISSESAGNFAQGLINENGTNQDVVDINIQLRTGSFGPIGLAGTPKLGETVLVVVTRKNVTVGFDQITGLYNVSGMQWMAKIDGTEALSLDLTKPRKFSGAAISWENPQAPRPRTGKGTPNPVPPVKGDPRVVRPGPIPNPGGQPPRGVGDFTQPIRAADGGILKSPAEVAAMKDPGFYGGTSYMWKDISTNATKQAAANTFRAGERNMSAPVPKAPASGVGLTKPKATINKKTGRISL